MKKCSTCRLDKNKDCFTIDKRLKGGLRSQCRECHNKTTKKWRVRNKERIKRVSKDAYQNNKEYYLEKAKKQWVKLSDQQKKKRNIYHKNYYENNRDKYLLQKRNLRRLRSDEEVEQDRQDQRKYYEKNKEVIKSGARKIYENLSNEQKKQRVASVRLFRKKNKAKLCAWSIVGNALLFGKIEKPIYCELCGVFDVKIHAHHDDYSKPLNILWLCHDCHMKLHANDRVNE